MDSDSKTYEVNFDGLIGPTHNFAGLAYGNTASLSSRYQISYPKQAALEGLRKMKLLHSLGLKQGMVPPQVRPDVNTLRRHGYAGSDEAVLRQAGEEDFNLLLKCASASSMWAANAATVSPSADTADGKVHITPANLITHSHRRLEVRQTYRFLNCIFGGEAFVVHKPLEDNGAMLDEGAANYMRLVPAHGKEGLNIFVYGKKAGEVDGRYPVRQTFEASQAIARQHKLKDENTFFVRQNPDAIDHGAFHNDVIAMSNENILIYHEQAFVNARETLKKISSRFSDLHSPELCLIEISEQQLTLKEVVTSYLFNSQLVTKPNGDMVIVAPNESKEGRPRQCLDAILKGDNPVKDVEFVSLAQSMANGGGPACLRLRVVLSEAQLAQVPEGFLLKEETFGLLEDWINEYYRDELHIEELKNYPFFEESRRTLLALTRLLEMGDIY